MPSTDRRAGAPPWLPDLVLGIALCGFGVGEALRTANLSRYDFGSTAETWTTLISNLVVALGFAVAAGCFRRAPGIALMLVWLAGAFQVFFYPPIMLIQLSVVLVAFGTSRYGKAPTVWASGLSIPLGALAGLLVVRVQGWSILDTALGMLGRELFGRELTLGSAAVFFSGVAASLLAVPWLLGLLLRVFVQARASRRAREQAEADRRTAEAERQLAFEERTQAQEVARLKDGQARLARDVHDVVGHSLAVILAQAESAQFLDDSDPTALRTTMANIAASARSSLQDVRQVLAADGQQPPAVRPGELDRIINGVAASGHDVVSSEVGAPQPLPPELDVVAVRVLQEMLTNAIKHGRRDQPVEVEQHWQDALRIQVTNGVEDRSEETMPISTEHAAGLGLEGMRRRLDSVGGRLDVRREGTRFVATAWVPLRAAR